MSTQNSLPMKQPGIRASTHPSRTVNRKRIPVQTLTTQPELFQQMISGKRIIIVGPSISVQKCGLGSFIDSFDVVIRLNKSLPIPPHMYEHIGKKTDILYNSCNTTDYPGENRLDPIFFKQNGVHYLRCPYPPIPPFRKDIKGFQGRNRNRLPFGHIDTDYYKRLQYNLGTRPYTGTCAISDLLRFDVKELFVMGMDFYTYKYAQYYRRISEKNLFEKRKNYVHEREPQIDLVRRFYLLDNRVVVDNILDKILLEKYDCLYYSIKAQVKFYRTCISASQNFIHENHPLRYIKNHSNKNNKKLKICLLGSEKNETINKQDLNQFDYIIDLFPERFPELPIIPNMVVFNRFEELTEEACEKYDDILITEPFKSNYIIDESNPLYKFISPESILFLNPIFSKYLFITLKQSVVPRGTLTTDVFLCLFFSVYFGEKTDLYIKNISPHENWMSYESSKRIHSISQRLLFRYLIKRNWIKENE